MSDEFTVVFDALTAAQQEALLGPALGVEAAPGPGVPGRGNEARLKKWWRENVDWGVGGDFDKCVVMATRIFGEHGVDIDPKRWCAALHKEFTGAPPGHAPGEHKAGAPMAELKDVEIARVGQWRLASGPLDVTPQMLADAADYANRDGAHPGYLKIGHTDPRFTGDGEPSLGWLQNLRVQGSGDDSVLIGDIVDMPDWLAQAAPKHWPNRSMEGWTDYQDGNRTYAMVVDGLALLGVTPPGMSSLRSLRDLPQALGVAASARIVAQLPTELPTASAGGPINTEGGSAVAFSDEQIANLRAKLELPETADEAAIVAAISAVVDESLEERAPVAAASTPTPPAEPAAPAQPAAGSGTMVIDAAAWEAREDSIKRLEAAEAKRRAEERDQVIGQAISAGKFPPVRREHWTRVWNADPEGTRTLIEGLTPNVVPVQAMGELGDGDDTVDEEFAHLFAPTQNGA